MKNEKVEIKKLGINGEGIGYINRKVIFIPGALIGEEVEVEIVKQTKSFYEGKLVQVITPSKDREYVKCRSNDNCLGCSLLHIKYAPQLTYKKEAIRESLRKYTNYDLNKTTFKDVLPCSLKEGFISSVNVPIVEFKGKITFGIYQRESKYLTLLTNCFKQDARINTCLKQLEEILTANHCRSYNDKFKTGLRFLKVKLLNDQLQLVFITGKGGLSKELIETISKLDHVISVFVSVNTSRYQEFEELGYTKEYGHTRLELEDEGQKYLVSVKSALPENIEMFLKKNHEISKMLKDSKKILSLNCGLGLIELQSDKEIVAIDEKRHYIEDCKLNKKCLRKENVEFIKGDIDDKVVSQAKKKVYDTFVIQNGRFGLSEAIKDSIRLSKVENVIYACDSHSTMAKDLADLEKFYSLEKIVALDTFVYTPYVTTIVKLKRK